jgi:hypothetical protein
MASALSVLAACSGGPGEGVRQGRIADFVRLRTEIRLEENADVITVTPRVTIEPGGGFLVTDASEGQIRLYSPGGRLRSYFGRLGSGPGEFGRLSAAARLPSRNIVAADMGGTLTIFDSLGAKVLSAARAPVAPVYNLVAFDERHAVMTGRKRGDAEAHLVHVVDLTTGEVVKSFFPSPRPPRGFAGTYSFAGTADVAVHGDTAAAIFALSDTVFLFRITDGRELGKIPFGSRHFRTLQRSMPVRQKLRRLDSWFGSFSAAARLFWSPDSSFYISFYDTSADHNLQWRLLHLSRDGASSFEVPDAPKLLSVSRVDASLLFMKPGSDLANVWSIGSASR